MKLGLKVKDRENKEEKNNTEEEIDKKIAELLSGGDEKNSDNTSENRFKFIKRPKKIRKIIIIAIIIVILFIISKAMFGGKAAVMPAVSKLSKGEIVSSLTITGPIEGTDSVDVTSNLHAKVTELNVKEGDSVIEGETVLARLDTSDIEEEIRLGIVIGLQEEFSSVMYLNSVSVTADYNKRLWHIEINASLLNTNEGVYVIENLRMIA